MDFAAFKAVCALDASRVAITVPAPTCCPTFTRIDVIVLEMSGETPTSPGLIVFPLAETEEVTSPTVAVTV